MFNIKQIFLNGYEIRQQQPGNGNMYSVCVLLPKQNEIDTFLTAYYYLGYKNVLHTTIIFKIDHSESQSKLLI